LPSSLQPATIELIPYLLDAFGSPGRRDYGTGKIEKICTIKFGIMTCLQSFEY